MKKIFKYLIIFMLAATLTVSFVAASDLVDHKFGDKFNALAPSDANIIQKDGESSIIFYDVENEIMYCYVQLDDGDQKKIDAFYEGFIDEAGFEKKGTEGNLTILEGDTDMGDYGAGVDSDGKIVIVMGDNLKQVKEIASSVSF